MRTKKALYNIVTQMLYEIVAMICGLILPRFILAAFGSSYNGMVTSITQFLDYISILTLGISGATRVAIYQAKDNLAKKSSIVRATEIYMRKIGAIFIVYMLVLAAVYPYIVKGNFKWIQSASLVIIIGLGTFAEYFFGITYRTFLSAEQSIYIYNILQIGAKIVNTIISVVLIKMGQSIQIVKLGSSICFVATPIALHYVVRKKFKIDSNAVPDDSALKMRGDVMAHSIANCVHAYTDIFLLTLFTNPEVISIYSVYTLVLNSLKKLQTVFTTGLEGAFGSLWAKGEKTRFETNFEIYEYLVYAFVTVVFTCAALLILPFVQLYTKDVHDVNYIIPTFAYLSVITYGLYCIRTPYLTVVQAAGKYKETRNGAFLEAIINFGISFIMVFKFGLIGVTIGTFAANLFRTVQYAFYISDSLLQRRKTKFFMMIIWSIVNVGLILVAKEVLPDIIINSWTNWIVAGICYFVLSVIIVGITSVIFFKSKLKEAVKVLQRMFAHKIRKSV